MFDEIILGVGALVAFLGALLVRKANDAAVMTTGQPVGAISSGNQVQPIDNRLTNSTNWQSLNASAGDLEVLARTIYGEARSESRQGREAVAIVILNRAASGRWPNSVKGVCLQPQQFSCWNAGDPNRAVALSASAWDSAYMACLNVAEAAIAGQLGNLNGANHYHTNGVTPYWSADMQQVASIGAHRFFVG
jgi:spore germination cell wall hydrolase CwlJ-like protein